MKKTYAIVLAGIFALGTLCSFSYTEEWYQLVSTECGMKALFPQKPEYQPQTVPSEIGELTLNIYSYDASESVEDENLLYMINYTAYPEEAFNTEEMESLDEVFKGTIEGVMSSLEGKILSEKKITLGKVEGRSVKIEYAEGTVIMTMNIFLVKNKIYTVQVISEKGKHDNVSMKKFLDSFSIIE